MLWAALENFLLEKKTCWVPRRQEKGMHKEGKKSNSCHSPNHQFLLSAMVANIDPGGLILCDIHITTSSQL